MHARNRPFESVGYVQSCSAMKLQKRIEIIIIVKNYFKYILYNSQRTDEDNIYTLVTS